MTKLSKRFKDFFTKKPKNDDAQNEFDSQDQVAPVHYCCMCGAPETDVNLIIRGGGNNYICDRCASMIHYQMDELYKYADDLKAEKEVKENKPKVTKIPTPIAIKEFLDQYVIGQDEAKKKLAIAVYNHYKRIFQNVEDEVEINKSCILLLGETGCGKTELVRSLAKMLDVAYTVVDANAFTQAGYVGEDVESIISRLYQAANGDVSKVERGIVMIDEIDKIAKKGENTSITRDVSGEGVQQALLKIIEGSKIKITPDGGRKHPEKPLIEIDTTNILFICTGAFVGIEKVIGNRMNMRAVGFTNDSNKKNINKRDMLQYITAEDVRNYGLIPELVGRLPVITYVKSLDAGAMKKILTEPKNAIIKQYKKLLLMDGIHLSFTDDALEYIVDQALKMKVGARGLRSVVEEVMSDYMYELPSTKRKKVIITKDYAQAAYENKITYKPIVENEK